MPPAYTPLEVFFGHTKLGGDLGIDPREREYFPDGISRPPKKN